MKLFPLFVGLMCVGSAAQAQAQGSLTVDDFYVQGDCTKRDFTLRTRDGGALITATLAEFYVETPYYGGRAMKHCDVSLDITNNCANGMTIRSASWEGLADINDPDGYGHASASFYVDGRLEAQKSKRYERFDSGNINLDTGDLSIPVREGWVVLSSYAKLNLFGKSSSMQFDRYQGRLQWDIECSE